MDLDTFKRDIKTRYKSLSSSSMDRKLETVIASINEEWSLQPTALSLAELKVLSTALLEEETAELQDTLEDLMAQKERIERQIARKRDDLQHLKYTLFNALEKHMGDDAVQLEKLHQIKLQSIDLLDLLEEMIESAIITTLEKGSDIEETLHEIIKEITFETLNANVLNAVRIRRILSSILQSALNVAQASPNQADAILRGSMLGIRSALHKSIEKFRQYLLYVPDEVKALYREEYQLIEDELEQIHTLFGQITQSLAKHNSSDMIAKLTQIGADIRFDTEELAILSHETVELLRDRLGRLKQGMSNRKEKLLNSPSAQEAKAMGARAWGVAKAAMNDALKGAKEVIDKK
jgi:dGTP triphosphohydrolase